MKNKTTQTNLQVNLADLQQFWHISSSELKQKSLDEIIQMQERMSQAKNDDIILKRIKDEEFTKIVTTYLTIYPMLSHYWSKEQIVEACAKYTSISNIVSEHAIPVEYIHENPKEIHPEQISEYLRTSTEYTQRYTKSGEPLLEGAYKKCHVYRIKNPYQTIQHGNIILDLLYATYPELKEFQFSAYGMYASEKENDYEIYPNNPIYTPFHALMKRDISMIIQRNKTYCKTYNNGIYTTKELDARLHSDKVKHYFETITNLKPLSKS